MSVGVFWTNRPDLNGFDEAAKSMIREAVQLGWMVKRGNKGHMVLRAPDKTTTAAIPPDLSGYRARENNYAPIKKWKRENLTTPDVKSEAEKSEFACDVCDFVGTSRSSLVGHKVSKHSKEMTCPYCQKKMTTPGSYGIHIKGHLRQIALEAGETTYDYNGKTFPVHKEDAELVEKAQEKRPVGRPKKAAAEKIPPKKIPPAKAIGSGARKSTTVIDQGVDYSSLTVEQLIAKHRDLISVSNELIKRLGDQQAQLDLIQEAFRG